MSDIRTPEDEIDKPGYFYPPFKEGLWYEGITYGGHTDYSVDWNQREKLKSGFWKWVQDEGDPVLAAADGTVAEIDKANGVVMINHFGGLWRTEYRHMTGIRVKVGDKLERGDHIGDIGGANGTDKPFSPHLHHVHWKRDKLSEPFKRTKQAFYGKPVRTSVYNSDSKPDSWAPPEAVYVQGPPPKATWESAFKEADKRLKSSEALVKKLREQIAQAPSNDEALKAQVAQLEQDVAVLQNKLDSLKTPLDALVKAYAA